MSNDHECQKINVKYILMSTNECQKLTNVKKRMKNNECWIY